MKQEEYRQYRLAEFTLDSGQRRLYCAGAVDQQTVSGAALFG
jgi:hypothetical protein